jgi:hypothetical protein
MRGDLQQSDLLLRIFLNFGLAGAGALIGGIAAAVTTVVKSGGVGSGNKVRCAGNCYL